MVLDRWTVQFKQRDTCKKFNVLTLPLVPVTALSCNSGKTAAPYINFWRNQHHGVAQARKSWRVSTSYDTVAWRKGLSL